MSKKAGVGTIKGVGEKTEKLFEKIGVYTVDDLIHYYPRGYEIFGEPVPISEVEEGKVARSAAVFLGVYRFLRKRKTDHDCIFKGSDRNNKGNLVSNAVFKKYTWAKRSSCSSRQGCEEKRFPCDGTSGDLRSGSPLSGKNQHHAACLWIDSRSDKQYSNQSTTSGIRTGAGTG